MLCPTCQHTNPEGQPFCAECGRRLADPPTTQEAGPATGALPQQTVLQGRYVIGDRLGQGGMGAVYRAADLRLSTVTWAIKEMSQAAITGPLERQQARQAFLAEAEMLAGLNHPHLPRVTDHFEQDGKAYLVMEYVPGETLLRYLMRSGLPQPPARVLEWLRQLCDVLGYLHRQRPPIIFRDLKPANIMLTPDGQLKLIDFGIARLFKPGQAHDTQAFGTVGYSAPEQYGQGQTDARSDVYALGVLMHQLLTGHDPTLTPFRLPPARQLNPTLPPALGDTLARATDTDPARRFADTRAFHDAMQSAVGPAHPPATSATTPSHAASYARPASEPIERMPAQHYAAYTGEQPASTGLANASRWVGYASAGLMAGATLLVLLGGLSSDPKSPVAGFGILLAILPLISGPIGLLLGIMALVQPRTLATRDGRRHAIAGIVGGLATLLLCCVIGAMAGYFGNAANGG